MDLIRAVLTLSTFWADLRLFGQTGLFSLFMEFFYRHLKEGHSKADALREAKRQMLQTQARLGATGKEESLAAPYFWAPFLLLGSAS